MSDYFIGGWTQALSDTPPSQFSYSMYGMITNLAGLTAGTPSQPGWSPAVDGAPQVAGQVLWTYGGGGCTPNSMPATSSDVTQILSATTTQKWAGVDFDDECNMNDANIIQAMKGLNQTSYTFIAGWAYNNPSSSNGGEATNAKVTAIAQSGDCDRFVLMCYGSAMWDQQDIIANVGPAITRTIANGVDAKKVVLALTPAGLDSWNLNYFLDQVTSNQIGGLFIWNYTDLSSADLTTICNALGIDANPMGVG